MLTTYEHARTNTFKVCIKATDYDKAIRPEVWPLRVGVRLFRPKRTSQNWAQQSATTGGLVQTHAGAANTGGLVQTHAAAANTGGYVQSHAVAANTGRLVQTHAGAASTGGHVQSHAGSTTSGHHPVGHHPVPPATPISTSNRFSLLGQIGSGTPTADLYVQN